MDHPTHSASTSADPALLTKKQLAEKMAMTPRGIDCLVRSRRIPVIRISRRCLRFDWNAVQAALAKLVQKAAE
jgi:hypothetical protein